MSPPGPPTCHAGQGHVRCRWGNNLSSLRASVTCASWPSFGRHGSMGAGKAASSAATQHWDCKLSARP